MDKDEVEGKKEIIAYKKAESYKRTGCTSNHAQFGTSREPCVEGEGNGREQSWGAWG